MKNKPDYSQLFDWKYISGDQYWKIVDTLNEEDDGPLSEMHKKLRIISIITGIDADELYDMPFAESAAYFSKLNFLNHFELLKDFKPKTIKIGDTTYNVITDISKLTTAQFIDYQYFVSLPFRDSYDKILSVFLIPVGCKYNDGYDIVDLQHQIRKSMNWVMVQSLLNFTHAKFVASSRISLTFFKQMTKAQKRQLIKEILQLKTATSHGSVS